MKILVCSDSHGKDELLEAIIKENADLDAFIFLGDGCDDVQYLQEKGLVPELDDKPVLMVWGNVDDESLAPKNLIGEELFGHKFYIAHGYNERCKHGIENFLTRCMFSRCDIGLFGHTHHPFYRRFAKVHLFNPSAVINGEYGVITINGDSIDDVVFTNYALGENGEPSHVIESPDLLKVDY